MTMLHVASLSIALALGAAPAEPPARAWKHVLTTSIEIPGDGAGATSLDTVGFVDATTGVALGHHGAARYTRDGGRTWATPEFPPTKHDLDGLEIVGDRVWAAGTSQLRTSSDGGRRWEELPTHGAPFSIGHHLSFVDAAVGWHALGSRAGVSGPLAATRDGGRSWTHVAVPAAAEDRIMAIHLRSPSAGYLLLADATILRTEDGGKTWTTLRVPAGGRELLAEPPAAPVEAIRFTDALHGVVVLYAERPRGFVALETRDGGTSWRELGWPEGPRPRLGNVFLSRDASWLTVRDLDTPAVVLYHLE